MGGLKILVQTLKVAVIGGGSSYTPELVEGLIQHYQESVILDICRDIEQLAPDAFMVNFTNPTGMVTQAVLNYSLVNNVGLCNLAIGTRMQIAQVAQVDRSLVDFEWVGINHLNWATKIRVGSDDLLETILDKAAQQSGITVKNIPDFGWDREFLQSLGALPCSYLHYYYMTDTLLEEERLSAATVGTRGEVVQRLEKELFALYQDPHLAIKPPQLEQRGGAYYSLAAVELMASIYNDRHDVQTVNVRNGHILPYLPEEASIEVNAVIDATGARPLQVQTPVTPQIRGLLQVVKAYEDLTIEAAINGDYGAALQALTIHPLVTAGLTAKQILDDILKENRDFLPRLFQ